MVTMSVTDMDDIGVTSGAASWLTIPRARDELASREHGSPDAARGLLSDMEVLVDGAKSSGTGEIG